jgi:hypothetical protein
MLCIGYRMTSIDTSPETIKVFSTVYTLIVSAFILWRLVAYIWGYTPPISFFGRIATRQLIIPGYDVVFVAPIAAAAVAFLLPTILASLGMPFYLAISIAVGLVIWMSIALPPTRTDWHYTGHHRIAHRFLAVTRDSSNRRTEIK